MEAATDSRKTRVLDNGLTYRPESISEAEYEKLNREYRGDVEQHLPYDVAKHKRNVLNIHMEPRYSTEIRYLAEKYRVGQAYIVRKMMDALKKNKIKLEL